MKRNEYLPLQIIKQVEKEVPDCWELVEVMREMKGRELPNWDNRCYIPISGTIAASSGGIDEAIEDKMLTAIVMAAVAPWRLYKQVYTFPEEMEKLLYEQAEDMDDMKIPIDVLYNLPYDCIYIESPHLEEGCHGFFVHFEDDVSERNPRKELRFVLVYEDATVDKKFIHLIEDKTIFDCMVESMNEGIYQAKELGIDVGFTAQKLAETAINPIKKMLQLVLYLCADNAEIRENPQQKSLKRIPKSKNQIKDQYKEIEKYDCGEEVSLQIRKISSNKNYVQYNSLNVGNGTQKRPHVRKGHWHHFWTGEKNSKNRKLILKWVAPTFVNTQSVDNIVSINQFQNTKEDNSKN